MKQRPCPSCGKGLAPGSLLCVSCGGFGAVSAELPARLQGARADSARLCPDCGGGMVEIRTPKATVDLCGPCTLVWLDAGEADRLPEAARERVKGLRRRMTMPWAERSTGEDALDVLCWILIIL